jgi:hypothetical protein
MIFERFHSENHGVASQLYIGWLNPRSFSVYDAGGSDQAAGRIFSKLFLCFLSIAAPGSTA